MMMRNMGVALVACHRTRGGVLKRGRAISPLMRSPERGIAWCVEGDSNGGRLIGRAAGDCRRENCRQETLQAMANVPRHIPPMGDTPCCSEEPWARSGKRSETSHPPDESEVGIITLCDPPPALPELSLTTQR